MATMMTPEDMMLFNKSLEDVKNDPNLSMLPEPLMDLAVMTVFNERKYALTDGCPAEDDHEIDIQNKRSRDE